MRHVLLFGSLLLLPFMPAWCAESSDDVVIYEREDGDYEVVRVNGRIEQIRVKPKKGAPYALVPQRQSFDGSISPQDKLVPSWELYTWKRKPKVVDAPPPVLADPPPAQQDK